MNTRDTPAACHGPLPFGVGMPRAFSSAAMSFRLVTPLARSSSNTRATSVIRLVRIGALFSLGLVAIDLANQPVARLAPLRGLVVAFGDLGDCGAAAARGVLDSTVRRAGGQHGSDASIAPLVLGPADILALCLGLGLAPASGDGGDLRNPYAPRRQACASSMLASNTRGVKSSTLPVAMVQLVGRSNATTRT